MPGDWSKKFTVGQALDFPAQWLNNVTDSARDYLSRQNGNKTGPSNGLNPDGLIWVQNLGSTLFNQYGVLGINGVIIAPAANLPNFQTRPLLNCSTPSAANHTGKFVIAAEPIAPGKIGRAFAFGYTPALININSTSDTAADILDGDNTQLTSGASGSAQILFQPGSTGTQWCLVRFPVGSSSTIIPVTLNPNGGDNDASYISNTLYPPSTRYDLYPLGKFNGDFPSVNLLAVSVPLYYPREFPISIMPGSGGLAVIDASLYLDDPGTVPTPSSGSGSGSGSGSNATPYRLLMVFDEVKLTDVDCVPTTTGSGSGS